MDSSSSASCPSDLNFMDKKYKKTISGTLPIPEGKSGLSVSSSYSGQDKPGQTVDSGINVLGSTGMSLITNFSVVEPNEEEDEEEEEEEEEEEGEERGGATSEGCHTTDSSSETTIITVTGEEEAAPRVDDETACVGSQSSEPDFECLVEESDPTNREEELERANALAAGAWYMRPTSLLAPESDSDNEDEPPAPSRVISASVPPPTRTFSAAAAAAAGTNMPGVEEKESEAAVPLDRATAVAQPPEVLRVMASTSPSTKRKVFFPIASSRVPSSAASSNSAAVAHCRSDSDPVKLLRSHGGVEETEKKEDYRVPSSPQPVYYMQQCSVEMERALSLPTNLATTTTTTASSEACVSPPFRDDRAGRRHKPERPSLSPNSVRDSLAAAQATQGSLLTSPEKKLATAGRVSDVSESSDSPEQGSLGKRLNTITSASHAFSGVIINKERSKSEGSSSSIQKPEIKPKPKYLQKRAAPNLALTSSLPATTRSSPPPPRPPPRTRRKKNSLSPLGRDTRSLQPGKEGATKEGIESSSLSSIGENSSVPSSATDSLHSQTWSPVDRVSVQCLTETNVGSPETGTSQQNAVREAQAQAQPAAHPGTSDCHLVSSLPPAASSSSGNTSSEGTHVSDPTVTAVGTVVGPAAAPRQQHHVRKWNTLPHSYSMKKKKKNNNTHNPTISPSGIDSPSASLPASASTCQPQNSSRESSASVTTSLDTCAAASAPDGGNGGRSAGSKELDSSSASSKQATLLSSFVHISLLPTERRGLTPESDFLSSTTTTSTSEYRHSCTSPILIGDLREKDSLVDSDSSMVVIPSSSFASRRSSLGESSAATGSAFSGANFRDSLDMSRNGVVTWSPQSRSPSKKLPPVSS